MHIASTVIANAGENDIVFGISFSGETSYKRFCFM
ncbi:hypothetical protein CGLO_12721 [Colletotrichum gloeosporioides Cg-14]|uniref:Uncharacterized protein n=1 Tax=Colletotrichum gloeosporioides (strain Cg-14) TaxID=1237896 RepID=T0L8W9_COLGC|nr:hypothetical protein CGLO_12721 [Colletotrichum gloeosporioides Cg-14]